MVYPMPSINLTINWSSLIGPHEAIQSPIERERARLLAGLSLALLGPQTLFLLFAWLVYGLGDVFAVLSSAFIMRHAIYRLSRTPYYRVGIALLVIGGMLHMLILCLIIPSPHITTLTLLPVTLAGLMWSIPAAVGVTLVGLVGTYLISLAQGYPTEFVAYYLPVTMMLALMIVTIAHLIQQSRLRLIAEHARSEEQQKNLELERERLSLVLGLIGQMSHDMMTPLTVVKTSAYLLGRINTDERADKHLEKLDAEAERLKTMVNDLVLMSHLDQLSAEDLDFESRDLGDIVRRVAVQYNKLTTRAGCKLELIDSGVELPVNVDEAALYRALANILQSVTDHANRGGAIVMELLADQPAVRISVSGCGDQPVVGLGLSIAQRIIEAHDGSLNIHDASNQQTTVTLALPFA